MPRQSYHQQLQHLQDEILSYGEQVEAAIAATVLHLKSRDLEASRQLIANDRKLDVKRYELEAAVLMLIATQQPMAGDMRTLAAVLFISNELERMADYAKGIARINLRIGSAPLIKPLVDIPRMADICRSMLHRSLQAFAQQNLELARLIVTEDQMVDDLYNQVYRELITIVMGNPATIEQANLLLWAAHNLERTADRVTNICERVIYSITGDLVDTGWEDDIS